MNIYILIFVFVGYGNGTGLTSGSVEFGDLASCQAASVALQKQLGFVDRKAMICANKGTIK